MRIRSRRYETLGWRRRRASPGSSRSGRFRFQDPDNPADRVEALCEAVRRFAAFEAEVVLCVTGRPPAGVEPDEGRRTVVAGLRRVAQVAAGYGLTIGVEPLHRRMYPDWTIVGTIPADRRAHRRDRRAERRRSIRRLPPLGHRQPDRGHDALRQSHPSGSACLRQARTAAERLRSRAPRGTASPICRGYSALWRPEAWWDGSSSRSSPTTAG